MQISNLLLKNLKVKTDLGAVTPAKTSKNEKFENYIRDMSSKQSDTATNEMVSTKDKKIEKESEKAKKLENKVKDNSKKPETKKAKNETIETESKDIEKSEEVISAVVAGIAEEFQISPEVVEEILGELGITVLDLSETENLSAFMQELYKVETPMDLLNIPDISEKISEIQDLLNGLNTTEKSELKENVVIESFTSQETNKIIQNGMVSTKEVNDANKNTYEQLSVAAENENPEVSNETEIAEQSPGVEMPVQVNASGAETNEFNLRQENRQDVIFNPSASDVRGTNASSSEFKMLSPQRNVNVHDIINQITENLKTNVKEGITEIKVVLKPEQLGDVTLRVISENGIITAKFIAENERVKEIIESNFNSLKDTLQQQGLNISELSVSVGQEEMSENMRRFLSEQQKSNARIKQIINNIAGDFEDASVSTPQVVIPDSSINYTA